MTALMKRLIVASVKIRRLFAKDYFRVLHFILKCILNIQTMLSKSINLVALNQEDVRFAFKS